MIYILPDTSNTFIRRLNDKRQLENGFFLFKLTNEFTKEVIYFALTDTSDVECAYNTFTLVESPAGSPVGGIDIPLALIGGQYEYEIYETPILTNNIEEAVGGPIERDMLIVKINRSVNTSINQNIYY